MHIKTLTVGPIEENCYVVSDEQTRELIQEPVYEAAEPVEREDAVEPAFWYPSRFWWFSAWCLTRWTTP